MADIYNSNKIVVPENLPEILTTYNNRQNIIIEKKLYGSQGIRDNIDLNFDEISKSDPKQSIDNFFKDYNDLFFDIPEEGPEKSHRAILEKSGEFVDIFAEKDAEIDKLEAQIDELQERIDELENPEEHPFYKNGTIISIGKDGAYFYMDKGKKRPIVGGRPGSVYQTLKLALGFKEDDDDYEMNIVKAVPRDIINQIDNGPSFDREDIGGGLPTSPSIIRVKLDPTDFKANPERYNSTKEYKVALEKEIVDAFDLERNMEDQFYKFDNDIKTLPDGDERDQSIELRDVAAQELNKARRKLAAYKIIYQKLESGEDISIEGVAELYDELTKDNFENITSSQINQFRGYEKGKNSIEDIVGTYYEDREVKFS